VWYGIYNSNERREPTMFMTSDEVRQVLRQALADWLTDWSQPLSPPLAGVAVVPGDRGYHGHLSSADFLARSLAAAIRKIREGGVLADVVKDQFARREANVVRAKIYRYLVDAGVMYHNNDVVEGHEQEHWEDGTPKSPWHWTGDHAAGILAAVAIDALDTYQATH
jgi:hypothetical protein